jgi:hypothetical protein
MATATATYSQNLANTETFIIYADYSLLHYEPNKYLTLSRFKRIHL